MGRAAINRQGTGDPKDCPVQFLCLLQLGVFRESREAREVCAALEASGVEAKMQLIRNRSGQPTIRVFVGPLTDHEQLHAARARLDERGLRYMEIRLQ